MNDSCVIQKISGINDGDESMINVSMADVSVDQGRDALDESSMIVAMGVVDTSMAGLSETSAGDVQKVTSKGSDGEVKRAGNDVSQDLGNTSMAGLSDYSMGDV